MMALCFVTGLSSEISGQRPTEYEVKAAFIYNFARFVTWPAQAFDHPDSPLVIGVYGENPFGVLLKRTVRNKTLQTRSFVVRQFNQLEDVLNCHMLFISASQISNLTHIQNTLNTAPILTISDSPGFCASGGMINFYLQQNRMRFEINPDAAERAKLELSSHLLKLAKIVQDMPSEAR